MDRASSELRTGMQGEFSPASNRRREHDGIAWSRYELKYLIGEAQAAAIAAYIRPILRLDTHRIDGTYPLVSLYLDCPDFRLCRESLEGIKSRFKLRIRSYSDHPDSPCYFEIKRRINQVIVKSRASVSKEAVESLLDGTARPAPADEQEGRNLAQFLYYQRRLNAGAVIRVRYERQAFESPLSDHVRVTFDRQVSYKATRTSDLFLNGTGWQRLDERAVVLEIKFSGRYPTWVSRLVQTFGLERSSMSKYARSALAMQSSRASRRAIV
jgi:hypothetical protein